MSDKTLRELQTSLPWTVRYHRDFRNSPMAHKDFGHALVHVTKAAGKLAAVVNDAEHGGSDFALEDVDKYVADLVVCALRMANTCPGRIIDLQRAVEERIETKNGMTLSRGSEFQTPKSHPAFMLIDTSKDDPSKGYGITTGGDCKLDFDAAVLFDRLEKTPGVGRNALFVLKEAASAVDGTVIDNCRIRFFDLYGMLLGLCWSDFDRVWDLLLNEFVNRRDYPHEST